MARWGILVGLAVAAIAGEAGASLPARTVGPAALPDAVRTLAAAFPSADREIVKADGMLIGRASACFTDKTRTYRLMDAYIALLNARFAEAVSAPAAQALLQGVIEGKQQTLGDEGATNCADTAARFEALEQALRG